MEPRRRASLLWGLVGALSFLVLAQGYRLVTDRGVGPLAMLGVALAVFVGAAVLSHILAGRLPRNERV